MLINLVNMVFYMTAFYLLKHVQIPRFDGKDKRITFVASILVTSAVIYDFGG